MSKSKIVLLTILIVLVLYCGGVIFVTKPNTNAYEALFGSKDNNVPAAAASSTEQAQVDNKAEHDAILAQAEKVAAEKADAAKKSASEYADAAIADAIAKLEIPQATETIVQGDTIIQREEFDLEAHLPEIVDAVYDRLLEDKDEILDMIIDALIERLDETEAAQPEAVAEVPVAQATASETPAATEVPVASDADYETLRRQMREEEIRKMLEQLHE